MKPKIATYFALSTLAVIFGLWGVTKAVDYYRIQSENTKNFRIVDKACLELLKTGEKKEYVDFFSHPMNCVYDATETVKQATMVSAGRDGKFDTDDDVAITRADYNKSRIVGEWASSRVKEFSKGVVSGFFKKE